MAEKERNTALPDENQSKVLGDVQVMARGPRWAEIGGDARTVIVTKDGDTGVIPQPGTPLATGPQTVPHSTQYLHDSSK